MEQPVHYWVPSIAPSGLTVQHDGGRTSLWLGALAGQTIVELGLSGDRVVSERRLLEGEIGRVRDVRRGLDGVLYAITDDPEGQLYRLVPTSEVARHGRSRPRL